MDGPVSGTLFVVATPIGNLEDITLRALRVLREVALVAAEDTRRTGNLLRHYGIATRLLSLHEHNEHARVARLLPRLAAGESVALVSDAGTPGISDPGARLVRAARDAGVRVEPVPGPSAVTAALSAAGLEFDRFCFGGFPPARSKARKEWFDWVKSQGGPVLAFEAPHRLQRTLADLATILGNQPIIAVRELTKVHEEWLEGSAADLAEAHPAPRGEFVLIIPPNVGAKDEPRTADDSEILSVFGQITDSGGGSRRDAIQKASRQLGISARSVYAAIERAKHSVE